MLIKYDKDADAKYFGLHNRKVVAVREINPWLVVDLDGSGRVVGVEVLESSKHHVMVTSSHESVSIMDVIESSTPASLERDAIQEFYTGGMHHMDEETYAH